MHTFALTLQVDQSKADPIDIVTEPPLEGRPLALFKEWIGNARSELKDGTYELSLSAPEDGVQGTGPDDRTTQTLRRKLVQPMTDTLGDLNEAYAWRDTGDDMFVNELSDQIADQVAASGVSSDDIKPGFLSFRVVCPTCGPAVPMFEALLAEFAVAELTESEELMRRSYLGFFETNLGVVPRKQATPLVAMVPGAAHHNPFAKIANRRFEERLAGLATRVETALIQKLVERLEGRRVNDASLVGSLKERFNLG